jgi:hypothetical protein
MYNRFPILILISLLLISFSGCSDQAPQEENMVNDTGPVTPTPTPSLIVTSPTPIPVPIRTSPSSKYSVSDVVCDNKSNQYDGERDFAIIIAYDSRTDTYRIKKVHYKWPLGFVREVNETTLDRLKVEEMYPVIVPESRSSFIVED